MDITESVLTKPHQFVTQKSRSHYRRVTESRSLALSNVSSCLRVKDGESALAVYQRNTYKYLFGN